jgi:hypothetical protein
LIKLLDHCKSKKIPYNELINHLIRQLGRNWISEYLKIECILPICFLKYWLAFSLWKEIILFLYSLVNSFALFVILHSYNNKIGILIFGFILSSDFSPD